MSANAIPATMTNGASQTSNNALQVTGGATGMQAPSSGAPMLVNRGNNTLANQGRGTGSVSTSSTSSSNNQPRAVPTPRYRPHERRLQSYNTASGAQTRCQSQHIADQASLVSRQLTTSMRVDSFQPGGRAPTNAFPTSHAIAQRSNGANSATAAPPSRTFSGTSHFGAAHGGASAPPMRTSSSTSQFGTTAGRSSTPRTTVPMTRGGHTFSSPSQSSAEVPSQHARRTALAHARQSNTSPAAAPSRTDMTTTSHALARNPNGLTAAPSTQRTPTNGRASFTPGHTTAANIRARLIQVQRARRAQQLRQSTLAPGYAPSPSIQSPAATPATTATRSTRATPATRSTLPSPFVGNAHMGDTNTIRSTTAPTPAAAGTNARSVTAPTSLTASARTPTTATAAAAPFSMSSYRSSPTVNQRQFTDNMQSSGTNAFPQTPTPLMHPPTPIVSPNAAPPRGSAPTNRTESPIFAAKNTSRRSRGRNPRRTERQQSTRNTNARANLPATAAPNNERGVEVFTFAQTGDGASTSTPLVSPNPPLATQLGSTSTNTSESPIFAAKTTSRRSRVRNPRRTEQQQSTRNTTAQASLPAPAPANMNQALTSTSERGAEQFALEQQGDATSMPTSAAVAAAARPEPRRVPPPLPTPTLRANAPLVCVSVMFHCDVFL